MRIRPKLSLSIIAICVIPLLLLGLVNYWNSVEAAKAALQVNQENSLANFNNEVSELLGQDETELIKLALSKPLRDYIQDRSESSAGSSSLQSAPISTTGESSTPVSAPVVVPYELKVRIASVLNSRTHFGSISLFDRERHPLLSAETQARDEAGEPIILKTKDFLSEQTQPDERVWTMEAERLTSSEAPPVFISPVSAAPSGARVNYTVPILAEKRGGGLLAGALVGELKLDLIFSQAAKRSKGSGGGFASNSRHNPVMLIVLDRTGRILYHTNEALKHQLVQDSMPYFQPVATQMFASESGQQIFSSTNSETYRASYTRVTALDVAVAFATSDQMALGGARRMGQLGLAAAVVLGLAASVMLSLYLQRKSRGIERVTEGVEAIAKGMLDHRIELLSSDDLRPLADNVGLVTKQLREQIAREAETKQFESFVRLSALLTHDVKNAIEALSLTVSNMDRHFDNAEFRSQAMQTLRGATEKLRALVARLSNPVITMSGEHKLPRPADLVPMLKRTISMTAQPAAGSHEVRINLPESLFALVDIERMDKVVENLVINALESMAGKNGTLSIEAGNSGNGKVWFSVSDTGEGMSSRFISEKLFHPFATTKRRGVGLGLYTCREVVRANGGSIEVDSREGAGTTFRVVLPSPAIDKGGAPLPPR